MGDQFEDFTLAAVQAAPVYLDRDASIDKAVDADRYGRRNGRRPRGVRRNVGLWLRVVRSLAESSGVHRFAAPVRRERRGSAVAGTDALCRAARQAGTDVVIGVAERDAKHARESCTARCSSSAARDLLGKHRKLKPTMWERTVWGEGDGSTLRLVRTALGRLGGLNCWEHQMVLPGYALMSQGLQVHAAAWPGGSSPGRRSCAAPSPCSPPHTWSWREVCCATRTSPPTSGISHSKSMAAIATSSCRCDGLSGIIAPNGDMLAGPVAMKK